MTLQGDLFDDEPRVPPQGPDGLDLVEQAVTPAQEVELAAHIDAAPLEPFQFGQWRGRRLTANYGTSYDYQRGQVAPAPPLPEWLLALRERVAALVGASPCDFSQALLIRYDPGAGIGWHRDRPQYGEVIGLSLSAPATLRLRRRVEGGFERRNIPLPPRSLYRLRGEVRWDWEHSIVPMEVTRRSITFRSLR